MKSHDSPKVGTNPYQHLSDLFAALHNGLHERGPSLRLCILAAIASESVFLLGPPGVAKSLVARRLQNAFAGAQCFDYLMGRFSTPEEIFGPISIQRLKNEDLYVRRTENYLPEADIVFLDEIWKASPPIQNALLTALNEKIFRNGMDEIHLPLKLLVAASNETAPDDASQAFWDRFLVRLELEPVQSDDSFSALITDLRDPYRDVVDSALKIDKPVWQEWQQSLSSVELSAATLSIFVQLRKKLSELQIQGMGPYISDRRWKKCAGLVRASAFCHGRSQVDPIDCLLLAHCLWNSPDQRAPIQKLVESTVSENTAVPSAAQVQIGEQKLALKRSLRGSLTSENQTYEDTPLLADDEYYVLKGLPPVLLVPAIQGEQLGLEARIWRPDFESLGRPGSPAALIDIFLYQDGAFQKSIEISCARHRGWSLEIDGATFDLKILSQKPLVSAHTPLNKSELEAWNHRAAAYIARCRTESQTAHDQLVSLYQEVDRHFFAPPHAKDLLSVGPKKWLAELADSEAEILGCTENHESC